MKIYIDLIILLNFFFDTLILTSVSIILKRNIKFIRIILGSLIGSLTIFILFIKLSNIELFLLKIILALIIIYITYGYKNIKYYLNNLLYFYTVSIVLGGFLYYLNIQFGYNHNGMIFYNEGLSINLITILISTPIIIYIYVKQNKKLNEIFNKVYKVDIYLKNKIIHINGYFDTGNLLIEPYKQRKVIIVNKTVLKQFIKNYKMFYVPMKTIQGNGLIECFMPEKVIIYNLGEYNDLVIGLSENNLNIEGNECILNALIKEKR